MQAEEGSKPTVSIVVPVKNGEETIEELLDSLAQLDYDPSRVQIVVVDGDSTDQTRKIVSQFPVLLLREERPGLNAARNTGIKHSDGEIVAFTDSDCVVPADWITRLVENFQDARVGCVGGSVLGYYDNVLSRYCDESAIPVMRMFKEREALDRVKPPLHYPAGCNMAVRRSVLGRVGAFNEDIRYGFDEDELVERICRDGHRMVLDPQLYVRHKHRPSLLGLMKQTFQYGRGGGLLLKMKGLRSTFSRWVLLCLLGFGFLSCIISSLIILTISAGSAISLILLLGFFLLPPISLMIFYVHQTLGENRGVHLKTLAYPFIDIARSIAFLSGALYQLLR